MARPCPHCQKPLPAFKPGAPQTCPACGKDAASSAAADVPTRTVVRDADDKTLVSKRAEDKTLADRPADPGRPKVLDATLRDGGGGAGGGVVAVPGPKDPLVGKTMGTSEILSVLGKGAMGVVYKARQTGLDRIVALKTIRPEFCTDAQLLERFQREARTVGRFNTPYVVQVYDVGFAEGQHYIVMEFVPGGSLKSYTQGRPSKRLTVAEAVRFMQHAAEGLMEAERLNIVHRDIKPENLLLDQQGRCKITDFGIAKMLGAAVELTGSMGLVGTPLYMSPEQCRGEELSAKSDMYSLGATFYHLLTGTPPCKGESVFDLIQTKTRIERLSPRRDLTDGSVPEQLSHVIERLTALKPKDRYTSFGEVMEDLKHIHVDEGKPGATTVPPRPRPRKKSPVGMVVAGVLLLGAVGGGAWYALQPPPADPIRNGGGDPGSRAGNPGEVVGVNNNGNTGRPTNSSSQPGPSASRTTAPVLPDPPAGPDPAVVRAGFLERSRGALAEVRKVLAGSGPSLSIAERIKALFNEAQKVTDVQAATDELKALLDDIGAADTKQILLTSLQPPLLLVPFPQLRDHLDKLVNACQPGDRSGSEYRTWLAGQLKARRAALVADARGVTEKRLTAVLAQAEALGQGTGKEADLRAAITELETARTTLLDLLPEGKDDWERLLGEAALKKLSSPIEARSALAMKIEAVAGRVDALGKRLAQVTSARVWQKDGKTLTDDLDKEEKAAQALATEARDDARLAGATSQLKEIRSRVAAWQKHVALMTTLRSDFGAGRHDKIAADLQAAQGSGITDADLPLFAEAWSQLKDAGTKARRDLDLAKAQAALASASGKLAELGVTATWTAAATDALQSLANAARSGMARVPGGTVVVTEMQNDQPKALAAVDVPGFLMDQEECTVKTYKAFFQACSDPKAVEWFGSADLQQRYGRQLPRYLQAGPVPDNWPIVSVNWYQAQACLRWQHPQKTLMSRAEWWLAAKGPATAGEHRRDYPWGSANPGAKDLYADKQNPSPVDTGGERVVSFGEDPIRHLAGNVAEWTRDEQDGKVLTLGGDYNLQFVGKQKDYFAGRRAQRYRKDEEYERLGFRGVLRPTDVLGTLLP